MDGRRNTEQWWMIWGNGLEKNHLWLNVTKTREMVTDFRRNGTTTQPLCILGENVTVVEDYRYQGVHLDNRLN